MDISDRATIQMVVLGSSKWYFSQVLESIVVGYIPLQVILKSGIKILNVLHMYRFQLSVISLHDYY